MTSTTTEQVSPQTLRRVIVAAGIGNFVEWFDFAVYGFLATTIAQQFFPSGNASAALLKTFAVFAVAFAFRPGAIQTGHCLFGSIALGWKIACRTQTRGEEFLLNRQSALSSAPRLSTSAQRNRRLRPILSRPYGPFPIR
ncbi:hypothetical protein SAMN04490202_5076 [Pseudomonas reinekei]|uniref:Uncharacterized protein n=1 Tax=Pseudomonas reinekei TaxID=395598 RepID=A0A1H0U239_PSERE|nr:hypothetical protein SAMN04490202_5076 [Pseudomonas reinekei]